MSSLDMKVISDILDSRQYAERLKQSMFKPAEYGLFTACIRNSLRSLKHIGQMGVQDVAPAINRAAHDGLMPDGREAMFAYRFDKATGRHRVDYQPMVGGIKKILYRSQMVRSVHAVAVYAKDKFSCKLGDRPSIHHEPILFGPGDEITDRGEIVAGYAVITLTNGGLIRSVVSKWDIARFRAKAKTDYVWKEWADQMVARSALKRAAKDAPLEANIAAALNAGDVQFDDEVAAVEETREKPATRMEQIALGKSPVLGVPLDEDAIDFGQSIVSQIGAHDGVTQ